MIEEDFISLACFQIFSNDLKFLSEQAKLNCRQSLESYSSILSIHILASIEPIATCLMVEAILTGPREAPSILPTVTDHRSVDVEADVVTKKRLKDMIAIEEEGIATKTNAKLIESSIRMAAPVVADLTGPAMSAKETLKSISVEKETEAIVPEGLNTTKRIVMNGRARLQRDQQFRLPMEEVVIAKHPS